MTLYISIYLFALGLILGSFYNVVGLRVPVGESIVRPPSSCPKCGTRLKVRDLIPVVSYVLSLGKCRHCGSHVSPLYPLGELVTGILFVLVYLSYGITLETVIGLVLVSAAVVISVSDLRYMLIPNRILVALAPVFLLLRLLNPVDSVWMHLWGALAGGGILLLIVILSRGGMGMGDVKLMILLGWVLGLYPMIPTFILACLMGSIVGGVLLLSRVIKPKQPIPFGPFLLAGAIISYLYGSEMIHFYVSIII
ncbi:prepilin peptidase [Paenibacillus sp. SN-8-1]|uniref:prepilin peptidase n=1 Tax=Paenibacillus sp. SN-8-1 TaxID=3435409 RepID=UPI003D9A9B46